MGAAAVMGRFPAVPRAVRWRGLLVVSTLLLPLAASTASSRSAPRDPACDRHRAAVAYHADGSIQGVAGAPHPCAVTTGHSGAESQIKVAPNGAVAQEPAIIHPGPAGAADPTPPHAHWDAVDSAAGLVVSGNRGAAWRFVAPTGTGGFQSADNGLYIDRQTGRMFLFSDGSYPKVGNLAPRVLPSGALIMSSAMSTGYTDWSSVPLPVLSENPRFTSAPAPAGRPVAVTGENPTYWCGNEMIIAYGARVCYRSLDGGASWQYASVLISQGVPQHRECGTSAEDFGGLGGAGYPQGDFGRRHPGRLWVVISCNGRNYLARSDDEAATWPILKRRDGSLLSMNFPVDDLRVDSSGNLYAFQKEANDLLMRISRNDGASWTKPINMSAPAVRNTKLHPSVGQWAVAIGKPGVVAASYLAARSSGGSDGYLTVTWNALTRTGTPNPDPLFFSSTVNPPSAPLVTLGKGGFDDYIAVDVGPDGTPWASFYSDCLTRQDGSFVDPGCAQVQGQGSTGVPPIPGPAHATTVAHLSVPS